MGVSCVGVGQAFLPLIVADIDGPCHCNSLLSAFLLFFIHLEVGYLSGQQHQVMLGASCDTRCACEQRDVRARGEVLQSSMF